jgi:hypothetical protein
LDESFARGGGVIARRRGLCERARANMGRWREGADEPVQAASRAQHGCDNEEREAEQREPSMRRHERIPVPAGSKKQGTHEESLSLETAVSPDSLSSFRPDAGALCDQFV